MEGKICPFSEIAFWERRAEAASKLSCPAACCRELAQLAFKLSVARGMQPGIRETILEGLAQRFQQDFIFASEIFAEMGLRMTEQFELVPLAEVGVPHVHVKQEPAAPTVQQAEAKREIEEGMACVAAALKDVKTEESE